MKTKHIVELVAVVGFFGLLIYFFGRSGKSSDSVNSKPSGMAGADPSLSSPTTDLAPSNVTPPDPSKPDVMGDRWVNGVDQSGNSLGMVQIDSSGKYLVSASTGPKTESRTGRAHF